jgi:ABC-2 type transport system permease protein
MSLWRLELLRLIRTPRAIALAVLYTLLGLVDPVLTKYENTLLSHTGNGIRIYAPPPSPADGLGGYVNEATPLGLIVVVALAAGALCFDARQGLAIFLRTRAASMQQLLIPRFAVNAAAASGAYLLGTLAAWYETDLLIGPLPAAAIPAGVLCGVIYLAFAVAVTALAAAVARSALATAGIALAALLLLPIVGIVHAVDAWLPSTLVDAPVNLASTAHPLSYYSPALAVTVAATAVALAVAVHRLKAREV